MWFRNELSSLAEVSLYIKNVRLHGVQHNFSYKIFNFVKVCINEWCHHQTLIYTKKWYLESTFLEITFRLSNFTDSFYKYFIKNSQNAERIKFNMSIFTIYKHIFYKINCISVPQNICTGVKHFIVTFWCRNKLLSNQHIVTRFS